MRCNRIVGAAVTLICLCSRLAAAQDPLTGDVPPAVEAEPEGSAPPAVRRWMDRAERILGRDGDAPADGFFVQTGSLITGAGLTAGLGYRRPLRRATLLVDASAVYSWRGYRGAHARLEMPTLMDRKLTIGAQYRWQDLLQIEYFGQGPASREDDRSDYRLTSHNIVGYANLRLGRDVSVRGRMGWVNRPRLGPPSGHFQRGFPSTLDVFALDPTVLRDRQPHYRHIEASLVVDTRDDAGYPTRGGLGRTAWIRVDESDGDTFSFQRYELEGARFMPLISTRAMLAVRGWLSLTDADAGRVVPFYLLPSLGGNNTVRAFHNYRFHDRHMAIVNAEVRVPLVTVLDATAFVDAGNVAGQVRSLNLDRTSIGVGLRIHTKRTSWARLDVARSREGWRIIFTRSDPLNPARWSRRTAPVPFVP